MAFPPYVQESGDGDSGSKGRRFESSQARHVFPVTLQFSGNIDFPVKRRQRATCSGCRKRGLGVIPGRAEPQSFTWTCSKPGCRGPSSLGDFLCFGGETSSVLISSPSAPPAASSQPQPRKGRDRCLSRERKTFRGSQCIFVRTIYLIFFNSEFSPPIWIVRPSTTPSAFWLNVIWALKIVR
jgi:hypothetical protein